MVINFFLEFLSKLRNLKLETFSVLMCIASGDSHEQQVSTFGHMQKDHTNTIGFKNQNNEGKWLSHKVRKKSKKA